MMIYIVDRNDNNRKDKLVLVIPGISKQFSNVTDDLTEVRTAWKINRFVISILFLEF